MEEKKFRLKIPYFEIELGGKTQYISEDLKPGECKFFTRKTLFGVEIIIIKMDKYGNVIIAKEKPKKKSEVGKW